MPLSEQTRYTLKQLLKTRKSELEIQLGELAIFHEYNSVLSALSELSEKEDGSFGGDYLISNFIESAMNIPIANEYNLNWSSIKKAEYFIRQTKRRLTTGEIADLIVKVDQNEDRTKLVSNLSAALGKRVKEGKMKRITNSSDQYEYFI